MNKFLIETYGCQMNKADSNGVIQNLVENGFIQVYDDRDADIVILNTCSVRKSAEDRIWGRLGYFKNLKSKKDLLLIIMGCMSQRLGEDLLLSNYGIDLVIGNFFKDRIEEIISNYKKTGQRLFIEEKDINFFNSYPEKDNPKKAFVTISHGCNNFCSYCIVPYLRGREKSRSSKEIIDDINNLCKQGVIQVTLLGQNVNSYGLDNNDINFPKLLKLICKETDIKWIKYLSSHPKDFTDELIEVIYSEDKVCNYLHLAVQSGSNKILKRMNRHYTVEEYINKVSKLKSLIPKLNLTTDIIVGFSGETESDFLDTVNLIKTVEFDDAYMYKYNIRESTLAAKNFNDDVPEEVKLERLQKIIELQNSIKHKKKLTRIGDIFEVIPERYSKKNENEILGLTKEDLVILFEGTQEDFNKILKVKATKVIGGSLFGVIEN
ncbi:MAG TPA: tRNA (N6-isopentenyl adenosine(37)-C2)-methylthiotransferase MiaB [Spirochaetota bacterium]|nr:tRNA (N6-isopentenyl adenosine(37)-C2)-methylthiotransferase MiaB [Spirochaetota bacterium]HOL57424.1 tRNA (N6-isopentenyl adenosine(37)-C2)-methylthiotransferase MiaB [Spirochaetota bacterium]HPP03318.1 tRNA (N6-isopentenyl adenosine(37)-C2)-methylthiotransferase MiaB [Spirochaetota bacterium]